MGLTHSDLEERVRAYANDYGVTILSTLGRGNDGSVWLSSNRTAVKAFYQLDTFERERNCYRRLFDTRTDKVAGFAVPELVNYDNHSQIIEMQLVSPPCVLDFGKAYVDQPPDYSPEVLAETEAAERELFEPPQWKDVIRVRAALKLIGIHYFDARPTNIMFPR